MRPPANAIGGDIRPLAARINPMKNRFLDTHPVFAEGCALVQAEVIMAYLRILWVQQAMIAWS